MNAFDLLSEPIRRYVYDRGWRDLRPIQVAAIQKIIADDRNYILVSPTASGKTEAAFLPILSKVDHHRQGVSVLYISPLIALINDQFLRIDDLCQYLDIPVTRWHGEANRTDKEKLITAPTGIVLITPESIEALFVNKPWAVRKLFSSLQYLIIDEIHSFLGTDRGVQLQSLLSRLQDFRQGPCPLVGLSATLGDYEPVKIFTGDAERTTILRDKTIRQHDVAFRYFEGGDGVLPSPLIKDLFQEVSNKKTLIFPNSRGRSEEVAVKLKKLAQTKGEHENYFSHHSSVDRQVREFVEQFAKASTFTPFSIACTSTLELGIDIGSVDMVAQIDATFSISSLVQRVGRSGRREGAISRLVFYATQPWSLLQALACWLLYTEGFIDPISVNKYPYDLLLHQLLSIVKQHSGIDRSALVANLIHNSAFSSISPDEINQIIQHLIGKGTLEQLQNELILGIDGEPIVNNKEFYSVFTSTEEFRVVSSGNRIGEIPFSPQVAMGENMLLAARMWKITIVDEKTKLIEVVPAHDGKPPIFGGGGGNVHPRIREKMLEILTTSTTWPWLDEAATIALETLRQEFTAFSPQSPGNRPLRETASGCLANTFTGTAINQTIGLLLKHHSISHVLIERESHFDLSLPSEKFMALWSKLFESIADPDIMIRKQLEATPSLLGFSKWGKFLPQDLQIRVLRDRFFDFPGTKVFLETTNWQTLTKPV